jgi:predicted MFS family arabinose efflux permease
MLAQQLASAAPSMTIASASPRPPHWLRLFLPFALGYYLSYLLRNANAVLAPELTRELDLSAADLGLLTSAYFVAFAAVQIPLGILLDRYGPRRVQASILLVAASGTLVFALGHDIHTLTIGRALIGFGVSACLMAGLKNFSQWYPLERQSAMTGAIMAAGGLGAMSASVPLELTLPVLGWRGIFLLMTAALVIVSAYVYLAVPDSPRPAPHSSDAQHGVKYIFTSRRFWSFAPLMAMFSGGSMAIQGLWIVPWFMNVDGLSRNDAARTLFVMSLASLASYFVMAMFATRLIARGWHPRMMIGVLLGIAWACFAAVLGGAEPARLLWIVFAFCAASSTLAYSLLASYFPPSLFGRVSTTVNLLAFIGAFVMQWGIGVLIDAFTAADWSMRDAFRAAFATVAVLQLLAWAWFIRAGKQASAAVAEADSG